MKLLNYSRYPFLREDYHSKSTTHNYIKGEINYLQLKQQQQDTQFVYDTLERFQRECHWFQYNQNESSTWKCIISPFVFPEKSVIWFTQMYNCKKTERFHEILTCIAFNIKHLVIDYVVLWCDNFYPGSISWNEFLSHLSTEDKKKLIMISTKTPWRLDYQTSMIVSNTYMKNCYFFLSNSDIILGEDFSHSLLRCFDKMNEQCGSCVWTCTRTDIEAPISFLDKTTIHEFCVSSWKMTNQGNFTYCQDTWLWKTPLLENKEHRFPWKLGTQYCDNYFCYQIHHENVIMLNMTHYFTLYHNHPSLFREIHNASTGLPMSFVYGLYPFPWFHDDNDVVTYVKKGLSFLDKLFIGQYRPFFFQEWVKLLFLVSPFTQKEMKSIIDEIMMSSLAEWLAQFWKRLDQPDMTIFSFPKEIRQWFENYIYNPFCSSLIQIDFTPFPSLYDFICHHLLLGSFHYSKEPREQLKVELFSTHEILMHSKWIFNSILFQIFKFVEPQNEEGRILKCFNIFHFGDHIMNIRFLNHLSTFCKEQKVFVWYKLCPSYLWEINLFTDNEYLFFDVLEDTSSCEEMYHNRWIELWLANQNLFDRHSSSQHILNFNESFHTYMNTFYRSVLQRTEIPYPYHFDILHQPLPLLNFRWEHHLQRHSLWKPTEEYIDLFVLNSIPMSQQMNHFEITQRKIEEEIAYYRSQYPKWKIVITSPLYHLSIDNLVCTSSFCLPLIDLAILATKSRWIIAVQSGVLVSILTTPLLESPILQKIYIFETNNGSHYFDHPKMGVIRVT